MNIELYTNASSKLNLDKNLTLVADLEGTLKDNCNITDPIVLIEYEGVPIANYVYIPEFQRYYYITKAPTAVRRNLWELTLHVDVRTTFKGGIRKNTATLDRSEHVYNLYLHDDNMNLQNDTFTVTKQIGNYAFGIENVILVTQS